MTTVVPFARTDRRPQPAGRSEATLFAIAAGTAIQNRSTRSHHHSASSGCLSSRGGSGAALRIPPSAEQVGRLFAGWREELASCRKFAPTARNYAAARLMSEVGLRVNEARSLDVADVKWELGRFGKLHVRMGKGARGTGPRERMVPLINNARATLGWFVEEVWSHFDDDASRYGAPLFPSERKNADGTSARVGDEALRASLVDAAARHLPEWTDRLTPHVLRHFCASQL